MPNVLALIALALSVVGIAGVLAVLAGVDHLRERVEKLEDRPGPLSQKSIREIQAEVKR